MKDYFEFSYLTHKASHAELVSASIFQCIQTLKQVQGDAIQKLWEYTNR